MKLDTIALKYNTDKSSSFHNYTEKYERYFSPLQHEPLRILEIGIQNGYSLKTWKEYFPNAHIYGVDIVDCSHMDEERITTLKGSQNDLAFLKKINDLHGPFDIIIDDGSHYSNDMRISFDFLFPLLRKGGIYAVEDIHCCYWPEFSDGGTAFMDRLKELMDATNGSGKCGLAEIKNITRDQAYQKRLFGEMDWWEKNIESIHLHRSIVFIYKQSPGTDDVPRMRPRSQLFARVWRFVGKVFRRLSNEARTFYNQALSLTEFFKRAPSRKVITEYRKNIKVYDAFIFFNELDLLEMRLEILNDHVDHFVLVEATRTFTGNPKPLYYADNKDRFAKFNKKIIHIIVDDMPDSFQELQNRYTSASSLDKEIIDDCMTTANIPKDQMQWLREFYQKEQIKKGLKDVHDVDMCYISDIDEIWNPETLIDYRRDVVFKMQELVYAYYLNNRSSESWYGTIAAKYGMVKHKSINHLDTPSITRYVRVANGGWHFTNQGGAEKIRAKIEAYGHQEFNNAEIKAKIEEQMKSNKDFVGRGFTFWIDEADLPSYITNNKAKYRAYFKDHE